jgi:predicted secreted protein
MSWLTLAAVYFTVWWTVLFITLPFGVERERAVGPGHEAGAPQRPLLKQKFLWTSVIAAIVVLVGWGLFASGLLDWNALVKPPAG